MSAAAIQRAVQGVDPRLFTASNPVARSARSSDKKGSEGVYAAYLMGGFTPGKWEITSGARVENTRISNTVWRVDKNNPAALSPPRAGSDTNTADLPTPTETTPT